MSAILGIFGPGAGAAPARAMLARMAVRGADVADLVVSDEVVLGVSRHDWECEDGFGGPAQVAQERDCLCVSDASLYYRDDLRRALASAGIEVDRSASPASLIIAAYRAWGAECATRLEGDFAFILYDRRERRVVASREFTGKRPLYHASLGPAGAQLVLASSARAITEHPACPDDYDTRVVAATIAQLWAASDETWSRAVREVIAGFTLTRDGTSATRVARHWTPRIGEGSPMPFDEAALHLRSLLERAAGERMAPTGPTAVWMSGGWDSPSVFAAGQSHLRSTGDARQLLPVSLSYPEGDPGREDDLIEAIAGHWGAPIRWIDVETIPLFVDAPRTAGERDGPFAHTYEHWNRRLGTEARGLGARVALDGNGGDQLFQLSDIFLADLFWQGRWSTLAREWRAKQRGANWRAFLRYVVVPAMPAPLLRTAELIRGRRFLAPFERVLPSWIRADFLRATQLREWERAHLEAEHDADEWRTEARRFFTMPAFGRGFAELGNFSRDSGVELRSPLLDARVVAFALGRPRDDRNTGRETKRLIRHAMRGLLPDHVLAPRTHRTGITVAYSDRRLRETMPALLDEVFTRPLVLDELGMVDAVRLRDAWQVYLRTGALNVKIPLFLTLHAELWLRARREEAAGSGLAHGAAGVPIQRDGDVRDAVMGEVSIV